MITNLVLLYLIVLYLSIPGFLMRSGYKFYYGLIPIVNLYFFFKVLKINPIFLIIYSLLIIFIPYRDFLVTMLFVFLPFIIMDAFETSLLFSFATLLVPYLFYPFVAYIHGRYNY